MVNWMDNKSPAEKLTVCVKSLQDVPVPIVHLIVVADPFLRTVTTPEDALTPA